MSLCWGLFFGEDEAGEGSSVQLKEKSHETRFKKSLMKQGKHEVTWERKVN